LNQTAKNVRTSIDLKPAGKAGAQVISFQHNAASRKRLRKDEEAFSVHIGKRIRMARMKFGKSQEWLGKQLGITFQQIQKMEKGTNRTGAGRLIQIANIMQLPISFFYEGLDAGKTKMPTFSGFELKVCDALKGITGKAAQKKFLQFARILAEK
jgi:transcriptional regulator with XRE-family HTH domain